MTKNHVIASVAKQSREALHNSGLPRSARNDEFMNLIEIRSICGAYPSPPLTTPPPHNPLQYFLFAAGFLP